MHYPWDDWERWAIERGLEAGVAGQARQIIREAYSHGWPEGLRAFCGWRDDGQGLFKRAWRAPRRELRCWSILMRTDGLSGDHLPRDGAWTWGYLRPDAQALLSLLLSR